MDDGLRVNPSVTIPESEIREAFATSGGPGGQHVNKTETKVEIRWNPSQSRALSDADRAWLLERLAGRLTQEGDLIVTSGTYRSQHRNRGDARDKLAKTVANALEKPKKRRATRPSKAAVERRIAAKKQAGQKKRGRGWKPED